MEEMSFLLHQFTSLIGRVRQECVLGGDEFPIENYALVHSVLKAENPQPAFYLNPSVNLLLILQSEIRSDHQTHFSFFVNKKTHGLARL